MFVCLFVCFLLIGIQIGFARPVYSFNEPSFETLITDIVLVREGGRRSEQTFQVTISVGGTININPATLAFEDADRADYRLTSSFHFIMLRFPPTLQNISFFYFLFHDELPEGTEAFRATSTPSQNFPNFGPPSMGGAFANTDVLIIDDDRKLAGKGAASCYNIGVLSVAVVVGFVQTKYNISEDIFFVDVCVRVFNPPANEDLVFGIDMIIQPRNNTAGKFSV